MILSFGFSFLILSKPKKLLAIYENIQTSFSLTLNLKIT